MENAVLIFHKCFVDSVIDINEKLGATGPAEGNRWNQSL